MADNPHNIEKDVRGESLSTLTGKLEGNAVDKIVQLKHDFATGDSQNLHQIEKAIKQYNKTLASFVGDDSVRNTSETYFTSSLDAGYLPSSITGFFDNVTNEALFDFYSENSSNLETYLFGFRKINPDYTGYACRIRRQYDLAEADVKFNSDGVVATDSEVVLNSNGFGTGLRDTELTFSGFCCPSYLTAGIKDSIYATTTVSQLYNQGGKDNVQITGREDVTTLLESNGEGKIEKGESFALNVTDSANATYSNFAETADHDGEKDWVIFDGTGINIGGEIIQFPRYGKTRAGSSFLQTLFPVTTNVGGTNTLRWQIRSASRFPSSTNTYTKVADSRKSTSLADGEGYSNTTITGTHTNRPSDFTSWTMDVGLFGGFDTSTTFQWSTKLLNDQPIVATGAANLMLEDNGRPCMEFKKEGNHSVLHHGGNFLPFSRNSTVSFVAQLASTGDSVTLMNEGTAHGNVEGASGPFLDGTFIGYGLHYVISTRAWKAFFHGRNDGISSPIFRTSHSDYTSNGIADSGNNTGKAYLILSVQTDGGDDANNTGEFYYNGVKRRATNVSNGEPSYNNSSIRFGARLDSNGDLTEGFIGKLYEMQFYDDDAQMDQDELNRFTGDINSFYNIT